MFCTLPLSHSVSSFMLVKHVLGILFHDFLSVLQLQPSSNPVSFSLEIFPKSCTSPAIDSIHWYILNFSRRQNQEICQIGICVDSHKYHHAYLPNCSVNCYVALSGLLLCLYRTFVLCAFTENSSGLFLSLCFSFLVSILTELELCLLLSQHMFMLYF